MKEFVITHGSILTTKGLLKAGSVVQLDEAEAKRMDPQGDTLLEKSKYDARQAAEKAAKAAESKALAEAEAEAKKAAEKAAASKGKE